MNKRMLLSLTAALLIAFLARSTAGTATQPATGKGSLHGIVTDSSGAAIPGASVVVSSGITVRTVATDEAGQYTVAGLLPGHYRVQIDSAGFTRLVRSGLVLSSGYETEADAQLTVSALKQEITVSAGELD
jgi:hypothetical protein